MPDLRTSDLTGPMTSMNFYSGTICVVGGKRFTTGIKADAGNAMTL
jgi:hypothetical protein